MELKTFIFMGRSGSGKGTQAKLLIEEIEKRDTGHPVFYLETGKFFREYVTKEGYTNKLAKEIVEGGGRVNSFLAIWMWTNALIANLKGNEHLVIDGSPRAIQEAQIMDTAVDFYKRGNPTIVYINTSRAWCEARLTERHRNDDLTIEHIRKKLDWFESDVEGAIWWYRNQNKYKFIEINGEQEVEKVQAEIMSKLQILLL
ncbi:MAG TPA: nucleoside monophosphate kinase [Candidatus Paceibacterota bacterium]